MQIKFLENRTGSNVTFQRFVLSSYSSIQQERTHEIELVPGYNALPDDATEVPPYYGFDKDRPFGAPKGETLDTDQYFEMSRIILQQGNEMLWSYSDYSAADALIRSPGPTVEKRGDLTNRSSLDMVGGHGEMIGARKISFDRANITQAFLTKEELNRITLELGARWRPGD